MAVNVNMVGRKEAQSLMKPEQVTEIIKLLTQKSVALRAMRKLPNMSSKVTRMPILDALPMAYFVNGDTGQKKTTKAEWKDKFITAEEIAVIVPLPESVIDDAGFNITAEMIPLIVEAFGAKIDEAIINGTDAPSTWPMGLINLAKNKGHEVKLAGSETDQDFYKKILGVDGLYHSVEKDGFPVTGLMGSIDAKAYLRGLTDTTGRPLSVGGADINGQAVNYVTNGTWTDDKTMLIAGDFTKAVYAIRQDITMKKFTEGVIQNPDGSIAYNLMQNDMIAIRFVMRMGWQVANPVSRMNPDQATRFPLSILSKNDSTALKTVTFKVYSDEGSSSPVEGATVTMGSIVKKTVSGTATIDVPNNFSGEWAVFKDDIARTGKLEKVTGAKTVTIKGFAPIKGV